MDYGKLLTRAWHIVWTNKWMFVLGFLAALGSGGSGGGGGSNFRTQAPDEFSQFSGEFSNIMSQIAPYIIVLIGFFFVVAIILWLLRLIGEAGMIASVARIESGEKLTLRDGFQAGMSHLKNMVGLSLVLYAPFILVGLVFAGGAISLALGGLDSGEELLARGFGLIGLCLIPLACILVVVGLVLAFVYPMAQRGIILEGFGVTDGIRRGWQVLRENLADIFLLAILFAFISLIVGIATLVITTTKGGGLNMRTAQSGLNV